MTRREALDRLRRHEGELRAMGATALFLFGSTARDEASAVSDIDVFFEENADAKLSLWDLSGIKLRLEEIMETRVDVMGRSDLHPRLRPYIEADAFRVY